MIASTKNEQVKYVQNLVKKGKARREEDKYVVEGLRICRELDPEEICDGFPGAIIRWFQTA